MTNESINSILFGLGIFFEAFLLIGLKKENLKEILKDLGGGLLFVFIVVNAMAKTDEKLDYGAFIFLTYIFYLGFGAAFTLSFKKKILLKINEINLFVLNILFLYYCVTRLGFDNYFTKIIYIPAFVILTVILSKIKLSNIHKGLLYMWYMMLFIIVGIINIYQIGGDKAGAFSSYLTTFFIGGIFLYIWIYFICLIMFTKILDFFLDKRRRDVYKGRMDLIEHFSNLADSFNATGANNFKILTMFALLFSLLTLNYYNNYISESLLTGFILFIVSVLSAKRVDPIKKDAKNR